MYNVTILFGKQDGSYHGDKRVENNTQQVFPSFCERGMEELSLNFFNF